MKTQLVKITDVKINPNNPRIIKDDKFKKLVQSITDFPEMLNVRPIVVNSDMVVLGGNMRLKACKEAGMDEIPVIIADSFTPEQEKEFLIKDNVSGGEWDWALLANEWEPEDLNIWGLDVWTNGHDIDLDKFFEEDKAEKEQKFKILLEYNEEDYNKVVEAFRKKTGTKEDIVFNFLIQ
jgi:hypothetical protein